MRSSPLIMPCPKRVDREGTTTEGSNPGPQPVVVQAVMRWRVFVAWALLGGLATIGAATGYIGLQQALRIAADHPQVELARAVAARLNGGASPASVVAGDPVELRTSSATYLIVVDSRGAVLATSAQLDGGAVVPPSGIFDFVRDHGEDVITWQPSAGVRSAIVVDAFDGGYVVAGRSLRWTEDAESTLELAVVGAWAIAVILAGLIAVVGGRLLGPPRPSESQSGRLGTP